MASSQSNSWWKHLKEDISTYLMVFASLFFRSSRFAYAGFMVKEFYPHLDQSEVGYYTGILVGVVFFGITVNGPPVGYVSDHYGIYPPMLLSCSSGVVFPLLFAFSPNYWFAVFVSFLYGALDGCVTLSRVKIPAERVAYALGMLFGASNVLGPTMGGYLAYPCDKYMFLKDVEWLQRYPFALVNILCSGMSVIALTMMVHEYRAHKSATNAIRKSGLTPSPSSAGSLSFFQYLKTNNTQVMRIMTVYAVLGALHIIPSEVYPLLLMLPKSKGGFGLDTNGIGTMGLVQGGLIILGSVLAPYFNKAVGYRESILWTSIVSIPILVLLPLSTALPNLTAAYVIASLLMGLGRQFLGQFSFTAGIVLTNFSSNPSYLARVTGLSYSLLSFVRFTVASVCSALFAWSSSSTMPYPFDRSLVFYVYAILGMIASYLAYKIDPLRNSPAFPSTSGNDGGHQHQPHAGGEVEDEHVNIALEENTFEDPDESAVY
eukprot:PhF_6_TR20778/c0_g1_i1/m.29823